MQSNVQSPETTKIRTVALVLGISLLFLGIVGFLPGFTFIPDTISHPTSSVYPDPGYGYIFGLFPTNYFHNAIRLLVGLWGIAAFTSLGGAISFLQIYAVLYAGEALFGLFPFANTLFGTMPLYGGNVILSLVTAAIAAYYGFVQPGLLNKGTGITANFQ